MIPPVMRVPCSTHRRQVLTQVDHVVAGARAGDRRADRVAVRRQPVVEAALDTVAVSPAAKLPTRVPASAVEVANTVWRGSLRRWKAKIGSSIGAWK